MSVSRSYRGYVLESDRPEDGVDISQRGEKIDHVDTWAEAFATIDEWMVGR